MPRVSCRTSRPQQPEILRENRFPTVSELSLVPQITLNKPVCPPSSHFHKRTKRLDSRWRLANDRGTVNTSETLQQ